MKITINNKKFTNPKDFIEYLYSQEYGKIKDKELIFQMSLDEFQEYIREMLKNERKEILEPLIEEMKDLLGDFEK